jgi:murein DD-endopeptidase MepM/ murein hydrolase activator NlpD
MDDDTFNPRNWGKSPAPPTGTTPGSGGNGASSLPEAWRDIGTSFAPESAAAAAVQVAAPAKAARKVPLWMASLVLVVATGLGAWLTRTEPVIAAAPTIAIVGAASLPGAVERTLVLSKPGDIADALVAAGVPQAEAQAAAQAAVAAMSAPGEVHALITLQPQGKGYTLLGLKASYADGSGAVIARNDAGGFSGTPLAAELTKQVKVLRGELDSESFYTSAVTAGVLDTLIPEFINAFNYDFNLASEIAPGDTFEVAYEQNVNPNGGVVGQPQLLYASLTTPAKSLGLYRFMGADGKVAWYDGNGASTQRGLMRTPVDGARITSNFGMRFHPVLHYNRLHAGVDFGVPVGTPVYAAAAGVVTGATPTGCGGNMVVIRHDNGWVTRYFHLSRYADGLHEEQRVPQGYTVGLSGTTGSCTTGPHLHYEVRIDGEPVDPLSVKTDDSERKRIEGGALQAFMRQRDRVDVVRAQQAQ